MKRRAKQLFLLRGHSPETPGAQSRRYGTHSAHRNNQLPGRAGCDAQRDSRGHPAQREQCQRPPRLHPAQRRRRQACLERDCHTQATRRAAADVRREASLYPLPPIVARDQAPASRLAAGASGAEAAGRDAAAVVRHVEPVGGCEPDRCGATTVIDYLARARRAGHRVAAARRPDGRAAARAYQGLLLRACSVS